MVDLTIIIVNHNSMDYLKRCLNSIINSRYKVNVELFVSDNNSKDGSIDMVKKDFPQVFLIENKNNLGYSAAANRAIRQSSGKYILILNNDIELLDNSLDLMVEIMDMHSNIGLLGCRLLNTDRTLQQSFGYFKYGFISEAIQKIIFNRYRNEKSLIGRYLEKTHRKFREVDWIRGACIMARRRAIEDVGLMDDNYFMYFEEVDLCKRIWKKGWRVCYFPDAKMIHHSGKSTKSYIDKIMIEYRKSQLYFYRKNYGSLYMSIVKGYLLFKFLYKYVKSYLSVLLLRDNRKTYKKRLELIGNLLSVIWRYK